MENSEAHLITILPSETDVHGIELSRKKDEKRRVSLSNTY
jgi:hypothetical protein